MANRSNTRIGIHHWWFDGAWAAYLLIKALQWGGVELPLFFTSHCSDILCMPVVFGLCGELLQLFYGPQNAWLSEAKIVAALIYFSLFFEWIWPTWNSMAVADPIDILSYTVGSVFFWYIQGKKTATTT